jgi:large subunit ribosomal protein L15
MSQLSLHELKPAHGAKRTRKRIGRGNASGKGTTAGRGGKGQTARTGGRNKLKLLGMRHLMLQTPKLRGFQSMAEKAVGIDLGRIAAAYQSGETVSPATLAKKGLIPSKGTPIKILAGNLKKKLVFAGVNVSEQAKAKIEAAGGEVRAAK